MTQTTDWKLYDSHGRDQTHPLFGIDCAGVYKLVSGVNCYHEYVRLDRALEKLNELTGQQSYFVRHDKTYYKEFVNYFYGFHGYNPDSINFDNLKNHVIAMLKTYGITKQVQHWIDLRRWDKSNDYMLDNSDAVERYLKNNKKPSYASACAVLLQGEY